jgi:hypothetical protein
MRFILLWILLLANICGFAQDTLTVLPEENNLHRYTIFLKGEFHDQIAESEQSFLLLAQWLYTHHNVRYLVFEYGPDFSYIANRYLHTQDSTLLRQNRLYFSKSFWDQLVRFNNSKPATEQIKIAGFDFNRSVYTAMSFYEMLKGKEPFADTVVWSAIQQIIQWKNTQWNWEDQTAFVAQMNTLRTLCKKQRPALMAYFGPGWTSFAGIVDHEMPSMQMVKRDRKSFPYVKRFLATRENGNVLFNLGVAHIFLDGVGLANLLEEDKEYRGKVCSLYPFYVLPLEQKNRTHQAIDCHFPAAFVSEMQTRPAYSLIDLKRRDVYPKTFKKAQWVFTISGIK